MTHLRIVPAIETDTPIILDLIQALAEYEKLRHTVTATSERLRQTLFGTKPAAEVILAYWNEECAGFAVFFATYSTFLAQPGLYLEDLYVKPHFRGKGIGSETAELRGTSGCRTWLRKAGVGRARLERVCHQVLQKAGSGSVG